MALIWYGHVIDGIAPPIPERGLSWTHPRTGMIYDAVVGDQEGALFWVTRYIPLGLSMPPALLYKPAHGGYPKS